MNYISPNIAQALLDRSSRHSAALRRHQHRWPFRYNAIEPIAIGSDVAAIFLASLIATAVARTEGAPVDFGKATGTMLVVSAFFVGLLKIRGLYESAELLVFRNQVRAVALAWSFVFLFLAGVIGALDIAHEFDRGVTLLFAILGFGALIVNRALGKKLLVKGLSDQKFARRNVVLITDQQPSLADGIGLTLASLGLCVTQTLTLPPPNEGADCRKRFSSRVIECFRETDVEEIIIEADPSRWPELRSLVGDLRVLPFPILFFPAGATAEIFRRPMRYSGSALCVELQRRPLSMTEHAAKRTLDIIGATLLLLFLAPILVLTAIAIKIDSRGPVLFRQQRSGFNGRSFSIFKFRTMFVMEDGPTITQAGPKDSRVTRFGRFLRRTSIDEMPQLLNVLSGSMSLVGPRPHALAHENQFDKLVRNYAFRRRVKPGLTGWAQVNGCRGPTPTPASIERRVEYDLWYVDNWSLILDFAILVQTPIELIRARNAY